MSELNEYELNEYSKRDELMDQQVYKWNERFMSLCIEISKWSTCLHRQVGAIIVKNGRIIATGYNGAPSGISSCKDRNHCMRENIESGKNAELCYAVHAEQNAIVQAAKLGIPIVGCTMYCTHKPCSICSKLIINSGISTVYYINEYPDEFTDKLFKESSTSKLIKFEFKDDELVNYVINVENSPIYPRKTPHVDDDPFVGSHDKTHVDVNADKSIKPDSAKTQRKLYFDSFCKECDLYNRLPTLIRESDFEMCTKCYSFRNAYKPKEDQIE